MFQNTIKIHVTGKNIERFIKRLYTQKIDLIKIEYLNYKEVVIKINKNDYDKILNIKTIYEIEIIELCGINKIIYLLKENLHLIISILVSFSILIFLSNIVFKIDVIHSSKELREIIIKELKIRGLKEKGFVKSYNEIEKIKSEILEEYKDKIEWLEIERNGVKYIVRVEERIITDNEKETIPRDIIAAKDAIIKDIDGVKGEIVKNINDYVKKGDTIITGQIKLYDNVKDIIRAEGKVYGEVWYQAQVEYPLNYYEEKYTGKSKNVFVINLLNKKIEFTFNKFEMKKTEENTLYKNNYVPFKISIEKQNEIIVIDEKLNSEEAFEKAILAVKGKINSNLKDNEKILNIKCLKKEIKDSTIILELFISVLEDITDSKDIVGDDNVGNNT